VPLLAIPPRVPPDLRAKRTHRATFGMRSIVVPPPVDFPWAPMGPALAEHAQLLDLHKHEILHTTLEDKDVRDRFPFDSFRDNAVVLTADDDGDHEVRVWRREDASWVVRRCRGIVRQLMEEPIRGRLYVVVIARGVAALHVMKGTGDEHLWGHHWWLPGTRKGLGLKIAPPAAVAEPWEQWHQRLGTQMATWWRLPGGEWIGDGVDIPGKPRTLGEAVDRLVVHYERRTARDAAWVGKQYGERPAVGIRSSVRGGDEVAVIPYSMRHLFARSRHPTLRRLLTRDVPGFTPIYVTLEHGAGLRWSARRGVTDVAPPRPVDELDAGNWE
jgi:hypothetical protein